MSQRFSDTKSHSGKSNLWFSPYSTIQGKDRRVKERSTAEREHGMSSLERMETDPKPGSSSQSTNFFGRERKESSSQNSGSAGGSAWKRSKMEKRETPALVFAAHREREGIDLHFCGFYHHSTRIAGKGTRYIFDRAKKDFQSVARKNCTTWDQRRELLFTYKRCVDNMYRFMMHHCSFKDRQKRDYWDDMYRQQLAGVTPIEIVPPSVAELSDVEMLEAVESMNES
nr:NP1 [Porcine bocavirus]